ncbi:hypothetical protein G6F63_015974 [Rhizopus arrhizus]|nr:hypothetical protein G6F63_015974 [Rhizopus arrhizus]
MSKSSGNTMRRASGSTSTEADDSTVSAMVLKPTQRPHRHHRTDELVLAAMRQGRTAAGMVIGRQRQHAAVTRGAGGVGVLEHVAAAVHAGAFAVPHAEPAVILGAGKQVALLRPPPGGG